MRKIYIKIMTICLLMVLAVSTMSVLGSFGGSLVVGYFGLIVAVIGLLLLLDER